MRHLVSLVQYIHVIRTPLLRQTKVKLPSPPSYCLLLIDLLPAMALGVTTNAVSSLFILIL